MKAALLRKPKDLYIDDIPMPQCSDDTVLIKVKEVGICGSDLHYFKEGRIGDHVVIQPHILGHEVSGIIAEVGRQVQGLSPGDRVSIEPGVPCMSCDLCRQGRYNLCTEVRFSGAPPYNGAFCEYLVHDARFVYKLPDNVTFTQGALAEPLAVAYNAVQKGHVQPGDTVLILGAGPIGFSCMEIARAAGAARIIVSEPFEFRRKMMAKQNVDAVIEPQELPEKVKEITNGRLCDCVLEASGADSAIVDAIQCVRPGGNVVFIGMGKALTPIPHSAILKKEAVVSGVYRYVNNFQPVINLLATKKVDGESWVSHRFELDKIVEAIKTANNETGGSAKVMIYM